MGKLLIVGTVAFDAIETPFGKTDKILGGAATYIGLSASNFGIDSGVVSVVGEDFPQEHLDLLTEHNVNIDGIEIVKGGKTFFWSGKYHNDMNSRDTLVTELNVLADFDPVVPAAYQNADVVMLGNLHPFVQMRVIEQVKNPKLIVLDTMNFWMDSALEELKQVIAKVDVITINDEEARQLSGEYSLVKAAREIEKMGPKYVVIKKGEHGALLFHDDKMFFAPALPLEEVFDPTGAGDTFAGAAMGYLAKKETYNFKEIIKAMYYGSAAASITVEGFGTEAIINAKFADVKKRFKEIYGGPGRI